MGRSLTVLPLSRWLKGPRVRRERRTTPKGPLGAQEYGHESVGHGGTGHSLGVGETRECPGPCSAGYGRPRSLSFTGPTPPTRTVRRPSRPSRERTVGRTENRDSSTDLVPQSNGPGRVGRVLLSPRVRFTGHPRLPSTGTPSSLFSRQSPWTRGGTLRVSWIRGEYVVDEGGHPVSRSCRPDHE